MLDTGYDTGGNGLRTDKSVLDDELAWASHRPSSAWSSDDPPSSSQNDVFYNVLSVDEQKRLAQYSTSSIASCIRVGFTH